MRVSVYEDPSAFCQGVVVTWDGVNVTKDCVWADEEKGEVEVVLRDKKGFVYAVGDRVATATCKGAVVITLKEDAPPFAIEYFGKKKNGLSV